MQTVEWNPCPLFRVLTMGIAFLVGNIWVVKHNLHNWAHFWASYNSKTANRYQRSISTPCDDIVVGDPPAGPYLCRDAGPWRGAEVGAGGWGGACARQMTSGWRACADSAVGTAGQLLVAAGGGRPSRQSSAVLAGVGALLKIGDGVTSRHGDWRHVERILQQPWAASRITWLLTRCNISSTLEVSEL